MSASEYLRAAIANHLFLGVPYTAPSEYRLALFTALNLETGGYTEATGGDYTRMRVDPGAARWDYAEGGYCSNKNPVVFPQHTASWGTIVGFGLFDEVNNLIRAGALTPQVLIQTGTLPPTFQPGALTFRI